MRAVDTPLVVIAIPARANLALRGIPEASMTKMNGARAAERVREDREKILSLRKVLVSGPRYATSGVEVERFRNRVDTIGKLGLRLRMWDKPRPQGRETRSTKGCMEERPERRGRTSAEKDRGLPEDSKCRDKKAVLPARLELAIFG